MHSGEQFGEFDCELKTTSYWKCALFVVEPSQLKQIDTFKQPSGWNAELIQIFDFHFMVLFRDFYIILDTEQLKNVFNTIDKIKNSSLTRISP